MNRQNAGHIEASAPYLLDLYRPRKIKMAEQLLANETSLQDLPNGIPCRNPRPEVDKAANTIYTGTCSRIVERC